MLQAVTALKTIKKKLVRKILDIIKKMAEDEKKCKVRTEKLCNRSTYF
jgi:heat shock protein beta